MKIHPHPGAYDAVILLIEDNDADARLVSETMHSSKIANKLFRVTNGEQALDYLHQRAEYSDALFPDLILLDLNMPRMDGREFLEEIKKEPALSNIPLVVLTTSNDDIDINHSYANLANCFISKPLDFSKFMEVVQAIEHFWLKVAKTP